MQDRPWTRGWKIEVDTDSMSKDLEVGTETVRVTMRAWHDYAAGLAIKASFRKHSLDVPIVLSVYKYSKVQFCDQIKAAIDYLFAIVLPAPRPKAFRTLHRRLVLAPPPKRRSRLRTR